jgi:hypothetical protein
MPDWAAARSFTGDPADLFVAFDELLEALRPQPGTPTPTVSPGLSGSPTRLAVSGPAQATGTGECCGRHRRRDTPVKEDVEKRCDVA